MIQQISPEQLKKLLLEHNDITLIDVREPFERENGFIKNDVNIPLSMINESALPKDKKKIVIYCRSGGRSYKACEKLFQDNKDLELYNLEGGFLAWNAQEGSCQNHSSSCSVNKKNCYSLEQQTYMSAGLLIMTTVLLGTFSSSIFYLLTFLIGVGFFMAGLRGDCMMTKILAKMPWNRSK